MFIPKAAEILTISSPDRTYKNAPITRRAMCASHVHPLHEGKFAMNALFSGKPATKAALYLFSVSIGLGATGHAMAQTAQFSSEADSISGSVMKTNLLTGITQTTTIEPVDQSTTSVSGSNNQSAPSAEQTIDGITVYKFSDINNSTDAAYTANTDDGDGNATLGTGNLLQGIVSWTSISTLLKCKTDSNVQGQIDCSSQQEISGLAINGIKVPPGTYPAGATFPVSGTINDPNCLLDGIPGQETFSGELILQPSTITGYGTTQGNAHLTGVYLNGTATCSVRNLLDHLVVFVFYETEKESLTNDYLVYHDNSFAATYQLWKTILK